MIRLPDGTLDTTTSVTWLQGLSLYADIRRPASLPNFSHARCLNELTMADCCALATQEGFAGVFSRIGAWFEWARAIDFQPAAVDADVGSLRWDGDILVEEGRDLAYTEHWHRHLPANDRPVGGLSLRDSASETRGCLVRVGESFMIARDRAATLPSQRTLSECVTAAATIGAARALIDCEISLGAVDGGRFRIAESTLPWRVGDTLLFRHVDDRITTCDRDPDGRPLERTWTPLLEEGDLRSPDGTGNALRTSDGDPQ